MAEAPAEEERSEGWAGNLMYHLVGVLRAQAGDALLDPILAVPLRMSFDHHGFDLLDDRLLPHRRIAANPGLVPQQLQVVAHLHQQLAPTPAR